MVVSPTYGLLLARFIISTKKLAFLLVSGSCKVLDLNYIRDKCNISFRGVTLAKESPP